MMFGQWIILPTDALFYLLCVAIVIAVIQSYRNPRWQKAWRAVLQKPVAMIAAVIFSAYVCIALLDSIHFHNTASHSATEMQSVLDLTFGKITQQDEESYSAPFVQQKAYLSSAILKGAGIAISSWLILTGVFIFYLASRHSLKFFAQHHQSIRQNNRQ